MKILLIICGFIFSIMPAFAEEASVPEATDDSIVIGKKLVLKSEILGEDRPYIVGLPASYNDTTYQPRNYPVLYILDGDIHFHATTGVINHMSNPQNNGNTRIPEMIVVAIPNTKDRMHDLTPNNSTMGFDGKENKQFATTGGGPKFLQFLEKELMPVIEKNYRTIAHRTFVGHSLGGLTVLHSFLTQPGLFQNYIAIDSSLWWDQEVMNKWADEYVAENKETKARIFMSLADHKAAGKFNSIAAMTAPNKYFAETLQNSPSPDLKVKIQIFPGQDHGSVPLLSLYNGLMHVFDGHKPSMKIFTGGADAFSAHFKAYSESAGAEFLPPEGLVDLIATIGKLLELSDEQTQDLFELNITNYPESAHAKKQLTDFLEKSRKND